MYKQDVERQYKHSTSCLSKYCLYINPIWCFWLEVTRIEGEVGLRSGASIWPKYIHSASSLQFNFVPETRVLSHHIGACKLQSHPTCSEVSHKRSIWRYLERKKSHQKSWIVQVFSHTLTLDLAGAVDGFWTFISNRKVLWFVKSRVFWGVCSSSLWVPWGFIEKYPQELLRQ